MSLRLPQWSRRLRIRLAIIGALCFALVIGGFSLWIALGARAEAVKLVALEAEITAKGLGAAVADNLAARNYLGIEQQLSLLSGQRLIVSVAVVAANGHVVAALQREHPGEDFKPNFSVSLVLPASRGVHVEYQSKAVLVWSPVETSLLPGWVRVEYSLDEVDASRRQALLKTLLAALFSLGCGGLVFHLLIQGPLRRVETAAAFARRLPENLGATLALSDETEEMSALVGALNEASLKLQAQEAAINRWERQLEARNQALAALALGGDVQAMLLRVIGMIRDVFPDAITSILVADRSRSQLLLGAAPDLPDFYNQAVDGLAIVDGNGSCGTAAFRGERVIVEDIQSHPYWRDFREVAGRACLASCWSEPVRSSRGEVLGTLAIYHRERCTPGEAELRLCEQAASLVAIALERQRNEEALRLAEMVYQASGEAVVVSDENNYIIAANPAFCHLTGYTQDEVVGKTPKLLASGRMEPSFYLGMWRTLKETGSWQGEIWNRRKSGELYLEWLTIKVITDSHGAPYRYVAMFSDITARKRAEETIWQQANYDQLTGLPNRRLFRDRMGQELLRAARTGSRVALLLVDLDRFKEVNDTMGHDAGDQLLLEVARRIAICTGGADTVARLGNDEFTVTLVDLDDPGAVERLAQKIVLSLAEPYLIHGDCAFSSASVGVTLYPDDGADVETLMQNADRAMLAAKAAGSNGFSWFTLEMQMAARVRVELMKSLRAALDNHEFAVHYQPIVDLQSGRVVKAEALLRWNHPNQGMVSPATFIPLAEEMGLIGDIGDWVFRTVAQQVKTWVESGISIQVSVNKSPRQFAESAQHRDWVAYLAEIGLPPQQLVIEITEGLLMDHRPEIIEHLLALRGAGLQIALDDFGTGYSALSYLQRFDIDYLKIDRVFIKDLGEDADDRALADAIVVMAHKLGIKVIAEGVETAVQRDWLVNANCDYAQGFLYAKALPVPEFEDLLRSR
ncbi:MAG TPA: EAL domain-containing protein [Rhodocyclaceae bacterium]